jgi:hypothetical protein
MPGNGVLLLATSFRTPSDQRIAGPNVAFSGGRETSEVLSEFPL